MTIYTSDETRPPPATASATSMYSHASTSIFQHVVRQNHIDAGQLNVAAHPLRDHRTSMGNELQRQIAPFRTGRAITRNARREPVTLCHKTLIRRGSTNQGPSTPDGAFLITWFVRDREMA